jgi:HSP20 family molecular chaperone IbpA
VDPDQVEAKLSDGVLTLTLQRPEHDKPKRIRISAG